MFVENRNSEEEKALFSETNTVLNIHKMQQKRLQFPCLAKKKKGYSSHFSSKIQIPQVKNPTSESASLSSTQKECGCPNTINLPQNFNTSDSIYITLNFFSSIWVITFNNNFLTKGPYVSITLSAWHLNTKGLDKVENEVSIISYCIKLHKE